MKANRSEEVLPVSPMGSADRLCFRGSMYSRLPTTKHRFPLTIRLPIAFDTLKRNIK